jgi:hypothetical protein
MTDSSATSQLKILRSSCPHWTAVGEQRRGPLGVFDVASLSGTSTARDARIDASVAITA